jgi:hypothetical protein
MPNNRVLCHTVLRHNIFLKCNVPRKERCSDIPLNMKRLSINFFSEQQMCWPLNGTVREERRMRFLYVSVKLSVRSVVRSTMLRLPAPALVATPKLELDLSARM